MDPMLAQAVLPGLAARESGPLASDSMMERFPRRLRVAFSKPEGSGAPGDPGTDAGGDGPTAPAGELDFIAYAEDCRLSGRTVMDGGRLTDMLNEHDEYALVGVTVERFEDGQPIHVEDIVVARDELYLVHASGPRGDVARRHHTTPLYVAIKTGPYEVRGFFHALPGADPVAAMRRRKAMVPLTDARVAYLHDGRLEEVRFETLIVNREQADWVVSMEPSQLEFPSGPASTTEAPGSTADAKPGPA
jgi:hypothetical protein